MQLSFNLDPTPAPAPDCTPAMGQRQRVLTYRNTDLVYVLQRSRRRSIGLTVGDDGLKVTAPSWVSLQQIEEAVREKFDWILKKLHEIQARQQRRQQAQSNWRSGGRLAYLGRHIELRCDVAKDHPRRHDVWFEGDELAPGDGQPLWLPLPPDSSSEQVRELAQAWLQRQAKSCFAARLTHFEQATGLRPTRWRLSSAKGLWGTCNADGQISLNWRLIHFDLSVIDYVIAHELAHLKELNHSAAFWQTVQNIHPDYLEGYQALKGLSPGDTPAL
jgi:predicted metal-dependent hydrolase